jgi:hypothetical protein
MSVKAKDLKAGDLVDLEGDAYADPNHDNWRYSIEHGEVETVEWETQECVAVYFTNGSVVGFPPDHELRVRTPYRKEKE